MRNANTSPKIPYSTTVREVKSDPESVSGTGSPSKVNQSFRLKGGNFFTNIKLSQDCPLSVLDESPRTDEQTDRRVDETPCADRPVA